MLGGIALLLVFTVVVVVSALETRTVTATLEQIRARLRPRAEAAYEIEINVFEVAAAVLGYMADPDTMQFGTVAEERRQLENAVATYERLSATDDESRPAFVRRLRALVAAFDSASLQLVQQRRAGRFPTTSAERAARATGRSEMTSTRFWIAVSSPRQSSSGMLRPSARALPPRCKTRSSLPSPCSESA